MTRIRESAKKANRVFHYSNFHNEDELRVAFRDYFVDLPKEGKPFDCPYVRTLTESIGIVFDNRPSWRYEVGDLICVESAKAGTSRRCRFGNLRSREIAPVRINDDGNLEFYCEDGDIAIVTKVVEY